MIPIEDHTVQLGRQDGGGQVQLSSNGRSPQYGQQLAHVADGQFFLCSIVKEGKPSHATSKKQHDQPAILKGNNEGFAYCDPVDAELTDASSAAMVNWFGQQRTKLSMLSMLAFNTTCI